MGRAGRGARVPPGRPAPARDGRRGDAPGDGRGAPVSAADGARPRPLVDYLVARGGPPPPSGLAYDYLLGGDGLWLAAENRALRVRAPVARCAVRGLPPLGGVCELRHGPMPGWIWAACAEIARLWSAVRAEVLLLVTCDA